MPVLVFSLMNRSYEKNGDQVIETKKAFFLAITGMGVKWAFPGKTA